MYENLNLQEWPFRTTADEDFASIWAGRPTTRKQIDHMVRKMQLFPKSGLHILWANFGMGKTHTLYHMRYRCLQPNSQIIPIYVVMPKRSTGFLELFREIVQAFLSYEMRDYLGKQLIDLGQTYKSESVALHPMFSKSPGVVRALLAIRGKNIEETTTAMQWLSGQPGLPGWALNSIGVTYRIKTPEDAISVLSALINLATFSTKGQKQLLLMIDEFQRVGELKSNLIGQVNSSLHTIINAHPTGLQLLLTFSCGKKENVDFLLSPELKSRAELQPIHLDMLSHEEGLVFIADLLSHFRIEEQKNNQYFPFTEESANAVLRLIEKKKSLTPRRIMLYSNHILQEFLLSVDNGSILNKDFIDSQINDDDLGNMDLDPEASEAQKGKNYPLWMSL
jgi:hypothetical protein